MGKIVENTAIFMTSLKCLAGEIQYALGDKLRKHEREERFCLPCEFFSK